MKKLEQKLAKSLCGVAAAASTFLSGCTPLGPDGKILSQGSFNGSGANSSYTQPSQQTPQTNYAVEADDANFISGVLGIFAGITDNPGAALLLGAGSAVTGREAIIAGQQAAAERIIEANKQQPGRYSVTHIPGFGEMYCDQQTKIAAGKGAIIRVVHDDLETTMVTCTLYDDHGDNIPNFPEDFVNINNRFLRDEKITTMICFSDYVKNLKYKLLNGRGEVVRQEAVMNAEAGIQDIIRPYSLLSGNYSANWYLDEKFLGKLEFEVIEKLEPTK